MFLLVEEELTREKLEVLVKRRPFIWSRFEGWLLKLSSGAAKSQT